MMNNLMDNGMEIPEMKILLKDHKDRSVSSNKCVPSRPVVSGRTGFNTHLSEVLSQIKGDQKIMSKIVFLPFRGLLVVNSWGVLA